MYGRQAYRRGHTPVPLGRLRPYQGMKLSWRGVRLKGNRSILMAAAAPRSLRAIR
jgi:hypothetical protein